MYHSYVEIKYVAMSFSPARTDLALKLLTNGQFFSLGSRVCIGILNPAVLTPHRLSLSLVTYPPLAVMPQVSTNLVPVTRLDYFQKEEILGRVHTKGKKVRR
jgi:hypothetical protein